MYPALNARAMIEQEQLLNLFPSCVPNYSGMPGSQTCSDQTGNLATKRAEGSTIAKQARAVEIAVGALNAEGKSFAKLYYFEKWRAWDVMSKMGMSKPNFYRVRRATIDTVAGILLGLFTGEMTKMRLNQYKIEKKG